MKKKKFIIIILTFLVILIGLIIALNILSKQKKDDENLKIELEERKEETEEATERYFSDKICPRGMATIYGHYDGANDINDLYRALYKFVNFIESIYDDVIQLDDNQLAEYYKTNLWEIKKNLEIYKKEEFINFVNYLKKVDYKNEKYLYCQLDKESYGVEGYYMTVNISFSYEGKENLLNFKTYFSYGANLKPEVKFEPIE